MNQGCLTLARALPSVTTMTNEEIARRFNRMAALMEVLGEDAFRIRSYRMAAEAIETWPTQMKEIADEQGLSGLLEIPGVEDVSGPFRNIDLVMWIDDYCSSHPEEPIIRAADALMRDLARRAQ